MPGPGDRDDQDDDDLIGFVSPASLRGQSRPSSEPAADATPPLALRPAFAGYSSPVRETARPAATDSFALVVYVLILMTVPTLGVAGVIALLAVRGRAVPADPVARSHHVYQRRTLVAAGAAAVVGAVLLAAPFAFGVTLLFALALWLLARGASGVWRLKAGRGVADPLSWWL